MQNHQGVPSTAGVVGASNTASFVGTNMVQLQSNDGQTKYYTVDMNAYSKMVSTQRPSNSYITIQPQVIPLQNNAGQQYVRIQLPNVQQGSNFVRLQSLPSQTNNMQTTQNISQNLVSVHTNLLNNQVQPNTNQQQVAIQLVQQPIKNKTQSELINVNKSPKGKPTLTPAQIQSSLNGLVPVMVSPHSKGSLVGTVSVGQATPVVHINNYVQQNMAQQPNTHQVAAAFFPASPVKKQQTGPVSTPITSASSSLFQALQAVNNQLTAPVVSRITSNTLPTVLNSLNPQQQLSLQQQQAINNFVAHHATQLPTQQQTLFYGQSNSKNDDLSSKGFPGTIMMLSGNHGTGKQQVLIPKTNPSSNQKQSSMFVPITMASNVSVTTNQASSILTTKRIENTQASSSNALRIQQQIAPRLPASTHPTSSSTGVANISINPSNQKILIPVQSSSNQQQYIIQSVPHHQQSSLLQAQQKQDASSPAQTNTKLTARPSVVAGSITDSKPVRKPCNCTKSQCLKLYCECFANGEFCNNCNCRLCLNNISHENERSKAIKACLERNPYAFHPKIGKGKIKGDNERRHTKGCNCKRSGCLKNYCECYEAKILCSGLCKCVGCKNFEESTDRQTLMHLADAAEVRVLQQNAANSKLVKQSINRTSTNQKENSWHFVAVIYDVLMALYQRDIWRLPVNFVTADVSKATCDILLACVQEAEALNLSEEDTERSVIEEFSRCLNQIIDKSNEVKRGKR